MYFLENARQDTYYWKWVLVSLHNSIQGFMVCALRDKDGLNVLKDSVAARLLEARKNNTPLPKLELDTFLNLYKKIQSDRMLMYDESKKFSPKDYHNKSIRRLNKLRNHFIHFTPKTWSMETSTLPIVIVNCLKVIRFLVFSSGNIDSGSSDMKNEIVNTLDKIELTLKAISHSSAKS